MTRLLLALTFGLIASPAFATWSILAVDRNTGEMVIASATCVPQGAFARFPAKGLMDVQAIIVPGHGIAAAQAAVDNTRRNQMLIYEELRKGTAPPDILRMLSADPAFPSRQFAILDLRGGAAAHSGEKNGAVSLHRQGLIRVPGRRIYYSVQGNILKSEQVVTKAVEAFLSGRGTLSDKVMAAMEAADAEGGDRRCTCDSQPKITAPCSAKTAHVAYILSALPKDQTGGSFNDGKYSMYLSATDADIRPDEDANPVKTLRMRYEAWKKTR
jgi:uncharacterized Ntn-hydrolase superfamily protein